MITRAAIAVIGTWELLCLIDIWTTSSHWIADHRIAFSNGASAPIVDGTTLWSALTPSFEVAALPLLLIPLVLWVLKGKK